MFVVSRRGFLPEVHDLRASAGVPPAFGHRGNVRLLLRELRMQIEAARRANLCWRSVVDALRPLSNDLWQELPLAQRQRFLRHLKTYWEPHRHRMAPEIRTRLDGFQASGALQIIAGRIQLKGAVPRVGGHPVFVSADIGSRLQARDASAHSYMCVA